MNRIILKAQAVQFVSEHTVKSGFNRAHGDTALLTREESVLNQKTLGKEIEGLLGRWGMKRGSCH